MDSFFSAEQSGLANQVQRQKLAENAIKLEELKRVKDEEAKARDILTKRANAPVPTQTFNLGQNILPGEEAGIPKEVLGQMMSPTSLQPQEGLTGFGGMSTPQQGPVGLQPKEDLTGLGGMQQGITGVEPTPTETPVANTPLEKVNSSAKTYTRALSKLEQAQQAADEMRKQGLHDEADRYLSNTAKLERDVELAKSDHLKNVATTNDHMAGIANSYQEAVQVPGANKEAAWQRMLINAASEGYPIDDLLTIPPEQRDAVVADFVDKAETTSQRAKLEQEVLRQAGAARRQEASSALRIKLAQESTQRQAASQQGIKDRWEATQGLARYKTQESDVQNNIRNAQRDRDDYDQQISAVDSKIRDIDTSAVILKPAEKEARREALRQDREALATARNSADQDVKTQESTLNTLHESFKKSGLKEEPAKTEPTPPVTADKIPSVYAGAKKAIEVEGLPADKIKAKFKEITGQDYDTYKPGTSTEPAVKATEIPAIKYITTQADLDRAIKAKLLKPNEIVAAKEKIRNLQASYKTKSEQQAEKQRLKTLKKVIKEDPDAE